MKKIFLTAALAIGMLVSCKQETKETDVIMPEATTDTVVVEKPVAPIDEVAPEEESDGTSVSVGSDGVSVDSKNGTNKTTVDVKDGKAQVEIKK